VALRDPNQTYTYNVLGKKITLPKGFELAPGVGIKQNKKSVEEGFKKLEKWLINPTPENWNKTFGKNNTFGRQLRAYLLDEPIDLRKGTGLKETSKKLFDELNVKKLIKPAAIEKINNLTIGGKGVSLRSIAADTKGNIRFTLDEQIDTIKNFQNGDAWLKRNRSESEIRKYANAIRGMEREAAKIGGFPFGNNSEKKLWSNLYRASYRGDRIKIIGEFADGNLPINADGKIDWKMTNKAGVPAWKRVKFVDTAVSGQPEFKWNNFKTKIDDVFGEGAFKKISAPYDVQVKTGSKRLSTGQTIKNKTKVNLLRAELFTQEPGRWKANQIPTEAEYNNYVNKKARGFNITEVHHPDGVGRNPWKTEPVFRYANREIDKVSQALKAGNMDLAEAKLEIDRINNEVGPVRMKLDDGYYGTKSTTQKATVGAAENYLDKFIQKVKSVPGGCRAIITRALGGPLDSCEAIIKADPERAAVKLNNAITATKGPLKNLKDDSQKLIRLFRGESFPQRNVKAMKDTAKHFGTTLAEMKKDKLSGQWFTPNQAHASAYLARPGQMKYVDVTPAELESFNRYKGKVNKRPMKYSMKKKLGLPDAPTHGVTTSEFHQIIPRYKLKQMEEAGRLKTKYDLNPFGKRTMNDILVKPAKGVLEYDVVLGGFVDSANPGEIVGQNQLKTWAADNPMDVKVGTEIPKPNKSVLKTVGKTLAHIGAPLPTALIDGYFINKQMDEGKSTAEIAKDPLNWLGLATMEPLTKMAGVAEKGGMNAVLRLGLNPATIRGITRFAGLPGLAISTAMTAYDQYKKYQNEEGFVYNLFNKEGT
jgi:hypothetical protein